MTDWHERYARNARPFGEGPTSFVADLFTAPRAVGLPLPPADVLCPGDGYGRNGLWLAGQGYRVRGTDLVPSAVADARAAAAAEDLPYRSTVGDLSRWPLPVELDARYDVIVLAWICLATLEQRVRLNTACWKALRAGGHIVVILGEPVTTLEDEMAEWFPEAVWRDCSAEGQLRLIGQKP